MHFDWTIDVGRMKSFYRQHCLSSTRRSLRLFLTLHHSLHNNCILLSQIIRRGNGNFERKHPPMRKILKKFYRLDCNGFFTFSRNFHVHVYITCDNQIDSAVKCSISYRMQCHGMALLVHTIAVCAISMHLCTCTMYIVKGKHCIPTSIHTPCAVYGRASHSFHEIKAAISHQHFTCHHVDTNTLFSSLLFSFCW